MLRNFPSRRFRLNPPAKILVALITLLLFLSIPSHRPHPTINPATLDHASQLELESLYEDVRISILKKKQFRAEDAGSSIRAPLTFPRGGSTFNPDLASYVARLRGFVDAYLEHSPMGARARERSLLDDLTHHRPPRTDYLPQKIWSTSARGTEGLDPHFHLWSKLLPLPLPPKLARLLPLRADTSRDEGWTVDVMDDNGMDRLMSRWTGETLSRGIPGVGKFAELWGKLEFGVLRADVFR